MPKLAQTTLVLLVGAAPAGACSPAVPLAAVTVPPSTSPHHLSPAEEACLAELPQAGSAQAPGRSQDRACVTVVLENRMSRSFALQTLILAIDGQEVHRWSAPEPRATGGRKEAREAKRERPPEPPGRFTTGAKLLPGGHSIRLMLTCTGWGEGVFSYLRGYRFEVRSSHIFGVAPGSLHQVTVIPYEKGDATTPLEERPAVTYGEARWDRQSPLLLGAGSRSPGPPAPEEAP